jgi:ribonuclease HI
MSGESLKEVTIYTDGACLGNPGAGGYGVVLLYGQHRKELSGGFRLTTNNRMEVMAAIVGLMALKTQCVVTLYTDSQYLVNAMTKGWAKQWQKNGWKRDRKEKAKNPDLWEQLLTLCKEHQVNFIWVKGHAGNLENECCDRLAVLAAQQQSLPPDSGYENPC